MEESIIFTRQMHPQFLSFFIFLLIIVCKRAEAHKQ